MIIGIDLDGVIFDSEKLIRVYCEIYDVDVIGKNSVISNDLNRFQERYNWNDEVKKDFAEKYVRFVTATAQVMPGAKEVLKLIKEAGHKIYCVTARAEVFEEEIALTNKRLRDEGIYEYFDKIIYKAKDKKKCIEDNNIDLMIDDYDKNCLEVAKTGIKVIYFKDNACKKIEGIPNIIEASNFGEVYRIIKQKNI